MTVFSVGDKTVHYTKMKLRQQLKLWPVLAKDLGPLVGGLQGAKELAEVDIAAALGTLLTSASSALEHIEFYIDAFEPHTKYEKSMGGENKPSLVEMKLFEADVLCGPAEVVSYLQQCIQEEFGAFLASSGLQGLFSQSPAETSSSSPTS